MGEASRDHADACTTLRVCVESLIAGCIAVGIQVVLAVSVNIVSGYARQLSLGQVAFAGLGAYTSAVLTMRCGWSFWLACPVTFAAMGGLGLLLGLPALRADRYYIPVMTLGMAFLVPRLLRTGRLVGNTVGWGRLEPPYVFGSPMSPGLYLILVCVAVGGCLLLDRWFWSSRNGQVLRQETTAFSQAARRAVVLAFSLSTALAGLVGSLFAHYAAFISPFDFEWEASFFVLALAACGGLGNLPGIVTSAVLLGGVFEFFPVLRGYKLLVSGGILLLVGWWFPGGFSAVPRMVGQRTRSIAQGQTKRPPAVDQPSRR
jgi:branched-chain amino acid transport system permease protein